jgi:hypothetical protein
MGSEFSNKLKSIADKYRTVGYWLSVGDIQIDDTKYYLLLIKIGGELDLLYAKFDSESNRWYTKNNLTFIKDEYVLLICYVDTDSLKERLLPCPF